MTVWDKSYWTAMDKEALGQYASAGQLGLSSRFWEKQLPALQGRIRLGAKNIELQLAGKGKGSVQGNITPGMHGKTEREEMRQLAKLNEVNLTTHGSLGIMGYAGFTQRGFDEEKRVRDVTEIKRAIDFAADVAGGGSVVIHVGEFQRPIYGVEGEKFRTFEGEESHHIQYLVNRRTGELVKTVRADEVFWKPKVEMDPKTGEPLYWEERTIYNPITKKREPVPRYVVNKATGELELDPVTYEDFKNKLKAEGVSEEKIPIEFLKQMASTDIEHEAGQAEHYEEAYARTKEDRDRVYSLFKKWAAREKVADPEHLAAMREEFVKKELSRLGGDKDEVAALRNSIAGKTPSEVMKEQLLILDKNLAHASGVAKASRKRAEYYAKDFENMETLKEHAIRQSAASLADLAVYAVEKERQMKKKGTYEKPLVVAPEAVFPEHYGSHPDELRTLVIAARETMVERLKKQKAMSEKQARALADEHIKCTFDIGHINTWKKYFTAKPGESPDETDKRFNKWLLEKAKKLQEEGVLGHVHLSDNFGYEDEHLSAGEGTAPIKEFVSVLRKAGHKGPMIVEGGAQGKDREWQALLETMRHFNSDVYTMDGETVGWGGIMHSYFDKPAGDPPFVVGAYAPDVDVPTEHRTWTLWSGVPLE